MRLSVHQPGWLVIVAALVFGLSEPSLWADTIELRNGGEIEGQITASDPQDRSFTIETSSGGRVTLSRSDVARLQRLDDVEAEYESLARSAPDTVDEHWKLAQWCKDHRLRDQYLQHVERIVELDPDDKEARRLLGYHKVQGQWMTRDMLMAHRGLVSYDGQFRTRQHVELLEAEKEHKKAVAEWADRIGRWRRWLDDPGSPRSGEARRAIREIRDPLATKALVDLLDRESDMSVRFLLIDTLARINDRLALNTLVDLSLHDPDEETRFQCLESLVGSGRSELAVPFVRALRDPQNEIVNRAALALQMIGDPKTMDPLIDALVTEHKTKVGGRPAGQHAYTFTPDGGNFSFGGGGGPRIVKQTLKNPAVRSALVHLSGVNFDYDQQQWRNWLATHEKQQRVDIRRDN